MLYDNNATLAASMGTLVDADGNIRRQAVAHGALTAFTLYALIPSSTGNVTIAWTNALVSVTASNIRLIVPDKAVASGATFWGITGGAVDDVDVNSSLDATTNKYIQIITSGACAIESSDILQSVFGLCTDADNDDNHDLILFDRLVRVEGS